MADNGDEVTAVDEIEQPPVEQSDETPPSADGERRSRPLFRVIGIIFIALAVIVGVYGTVAYMAWQRSQEAQAEESRTKLLQEIDNQLALAGGDIAAGNLQLARRRLEWILQREPDHPETLQLLSEIESQMAQPSPTPRPTPTKAAVVEEQDEDDELAPEFNRLQELVQDGAWSDAITALVTFQSNHPNYRRLDTDRMLYDAYINLGQELLPGDQVELGLSYFDRAEALGDLPQEVEDQRLWAELYLLGIAYYGVDWETAAGFFRDLCAAAPFFQGSCEKLRESLMALGDIYATNLDWCPAQSYYQEALSYNGGSDLREKLSNARLMCLEATPTPSAPITGTESLESALPSTSSSSTSFSSTSFSSTSLSSTSPSTTQGNGDG